MNRRLISTFCLLPSAFCLLLACGKRGDPRPPIPLIPQATSDLVVTQRGSNVILSWSFPALTTAGRSLTRVERVVVYRHLEELPAPVAGRDPQTLQPGEVDPTVPQSVALFARVPPPTPAQFDKLKEKLDSLGGEALRGATVGAKLTYEDTPPPATRDGRPIRVTYAVVTEGATSESELSNLASIVPLVVPQPPSDLTASTDAAGVALEWKRPGTTPEMTIAGYNIYRDDIETPLNAAPVTETKYVDTPPLGTHNYRVTTVASTGPPRVESSPSAVVTAAFKDLAPPPPPASVVALVETKAVRLVWESVDAPDLAGYRIYRSEGVGHGESIRVAGTFPILPGPHTATTWTDIGPNLGIAYRYGVASVDTAGNESKPAWTEWVVVPKNP